MLYARLKKHIQWKLYNYVLCQSDRLSDEQFIKRMFFVRAGGFLNLKNPQTFTEKQNWLKLHDQNPIYTIMADKFRVKQYVANIIGEEYIVPCIGQWSTPDDIDFDALPDRFVLKCNHNSGVGMYICKDKTKMNVSKVKEGLRKGIEDDFFKYSRVWPYKNIERCILADEFLDDHTGTELRDYKFWCFNGEPKIMYCTNKGRDIYENFYDMDFNPLDISHGYRRFTPEITKPNEFDLMKNLAAKLSAGVPFVRVDFFDVEGHVYFGEFTFSDWGGMKPLSRKWEKSLGQYIKLPASR